ncbi:uncharacterized protein LOC135703802 [Ochlerotatus camptorhynchus]|uniref:uncharacterized protein LOC135703802 n=1 Tax=Ochlerotatus camptorhynchus TaxID=644619 RepID=UPI0031D191F1
MINLLQILNPVLVRANLLAGHKAAMYLVLYCSLLLLSVAIEVIAGIKAQPVNYTFCSCPCEKLVPVEVAPFFTTGANCVYIKSVYSKGALFTADVLDRGNRFVYHDVAHATIAKPSHPHTAFWKIYYPWKNVSDSADVPLVIQNILSSEYMVVTNEVVKWTDREVVTLPALTPWSLWYFTRQSQHYKIRNHLTEEFVFSDEQFKNGWNEGKIFTDTIKRSSSDDFPGKYAFNIIPCYD